MASNETVMKKINYLRSVFKKEINIVKKSETSGTGEQEVSQIFNVIL